tara:strand:+ start:1455 stop:2126 length:672 start_codon:yes stop_codon:yes gene_type:complete
MHEFKPHAILAEQIEGLAKEPFQDSKEYIPHVIAKESRMAKQDSTPSIGPSSWLRRHSTLIPNSGLILDIAAGSGRHTQYLLDKDHAVVSIDKDVSHLAHIKNSRLSIAKVDLEVPGSWPFKSAAFAGIIVTNYLHRPLFPHIIKALATGGLLVYETFAQGNQKFGKPTNPNYLLAPGELIRLTQEHLHIVAYEDVTVSQPKSARIQRICASKRPHTDNSPAK